MTLPVGADSDHLRRPAFQPYQTHMRGAQSTLDGTGPPQPVPPRAEIDLVVNQVLPGAWEAATIIIAGLVALPQGDANQVRRFARLVEKASAENTDTAARAFGSSPGPHA